MWANWLAAPRTVEPVQAADFDTLEDIHAASFPAAWSADEQAALNDQPGVRTFVVRRGSAGTSRRPLGFITIRQAADEAEILTMAVAPRARRTGLGRTLLDAALRDLYAARVTQVFLEVDPANTAALGLYRAIGFVTVGERPAYYRDNQQRALTMRLAITQPASRRADKVE